jgi:hypothetical protein
MPAVPIVWWNDARFDRCIRFRVDGSARWVTDDIQAHLFARLVSINDGEGDVEGQVVTGSGS